MADIFGIGNIIGAGVTAAANYGTAVYNNEEAAQRKETRDRKTFSTAKKQPRTQTLGHEHYTMTFTHRRRN